MKIEIKEIVDGILRCTTSDERWYLIDGKYVPSVTWVTDFYPKGVGFYKWLANHGWDEAEALKSAAGDRGSKVHNAIDDLLDGKEVKHNSRYADSEGVESELTTDEYEAIMSFKKWFDATKPKTIIHNQVVFSKEYDYAGTLDYVCEIDGKVWLIDFKTSANVYPSHEIQLSAYAEAYDKPIAMMGILQLGYARTKLGYKLTEVERQFDLFLAARKIWAKETAGQQPSQKDYPLSLIL